MDNKLDNKPKYKNPFVVPVLSIAFLIIITMTISYGYYSKTSSMNTSLQNVVLPRKCVLSTVGGNASVTVNKEFLRYDGLTSVQGAYAVGTTTSSYIRINGEDFCSCSYRVTITSDGDSYTPVTSEEFVYYIAGYGNGYLYPDAGSSGSTFQSLGNITSGETIGGGTIKVATSGTQATHEYVFHQEFRYLPNANQIQHQGKNYKYSLRFFIDSCTFDYTLDSGYRQVEYIKSTGAQYINLGFIPSSDIEFDIVYRDDTGTGSNYVLGSRNGTSGTIFTGISGTSANLEVKLAGQSTTTPNSNRKAGNVYHVHAVYNSSGTGTSYIENLTTGVKYTGTQNSTSSGATANMFLFGFNTSNKHSGMTLYSLMIWQDGQLYKNYVPCVRTSDSVAGLCNTAFLHGFSTSGSGSFTAGPYVN